MASREKEFVIDSISSAIDVTRSLKEKGVQNIWFRGQSEFKWQVTPTLYRKGMENLDEAKLLDNFKDRFPRERDLHSSNIEWLTLMRHYDMPTRLVDWSTSLNVALFFACNGHPNEDGSIFLLDVDRQFSNIDGFCSKDIMESIVEAKNLKDIYKLANSINSAIGNIPEGVEAEFWAGNYEVALNITLASIDPESTNRHSEIIERFIYIIRSKGIAHFRGRNESMDYDFVFSTIGATIGSIVPFEPAQSNPRIIAQHGVFTIHGGKYLAGIKAFDEFQVLPFKKIRIPSNAKQRILEELDIMGCNYAQLFPEMEHQKNKLVQSSTIRQDLLGQARASLIYT